ncbi:glycosyltransferase [Halorarum halobium]|uniref:glycosyltransferase n=1 Tax=Halorarum halobium TaxID=3075121 RepID=UPI0028B0C45E|nr:glycosyltransferase [Halobaculum sp. XH14]
MRILWLRPSKGDNISVRRERIAEELEAAGYEIDIQDASGLDALRAVRRAITGEYDVIAGNVRIGLYIGYPLSKLLGKPFLGDVSDPISDIDYLSGPLFRFFEWYEWQVLRRADATVFVYESSHEEAMERGIEEAARLPNAVNYEFFAEPDEDAVRESRQVLEREGVTLDGPVAIYIGVFSSRYEIEEILATADAAPGWEFLFVGEGELEDQVRRAADTHENVYYPGAFEYELMPGFLAHADVGFCFKDGEQPLKLKEYGAAGLPIIVRPGNLSKWYGSDELLFVEPEPDAIADALSRLEDDEELRESYANAGESIARRWSWAEIADGYDELFSDISRRYGGSRAHDAPH